MRWTHCFNIQLVYLVWGMGGLQSIVITALPLGGGTFTGVLSPDRVVFYHARAQLSYCSTRIKFNLTSEHTHYVMMHWQLCLRKVAIYICFCLSVDQIWVSFEIWQACDLHIIVLLICTQSLCISEVPISVDLFSIQQSPASFTAFPCLNPRCGQPQRT